MVGRVSNEAVTAVGFFWRQPFSTRTPLMRKVVDVLDRFDSLTASLTDCLPAEIEARNQQYEYYRDRLLDFPRKAIGTE